jgi:hypothetical protein
MRAVIVHVLAVLLIAIFATGSPPPAKADCDTCRHCSTEAPAGNGVPCPQKAVACQIAEACASQVQKAPLQVNVHDLGAASRATFGSNSTIAIKSAYRTPETAPPRA